MYKNNKKSVVIAVMAVVAMGFLSGCSDTSTDGTSVKVDGSGSVDVTAGGSEVHVSDSDDSAYVTDGDSSVRVDSDGSVNIDY